MVDLEKKINFWDDYNNNYISHFANNTYYWMSGDSPSVYQSVALDTNIVTYKPHEFKYVYNSHGFRSEEFDNSKDIKILYGGCSLTEGIGLPIEHTWHQFLNEKISEEIGKPISNFNVGRGGVSIDSIVRFTYVTIEHKKFIPDMVCLLLPSVMRQESLTLDSYGDFGWMDYIPNFKAPDNDPRNIIHSQNLSKVSSYPQRYHDAFRNLLLLKWYLELKNIPFYFSFWDNLSFTHPASKKLIQHNYAMIKDCPPELRKHYIEGHFIFENNGMTEEESHRFKRVYPQSVARDGKHYGPNSHWNFVNNVLYPKLKRREAFNNLIDKWKALPKDPA